MFNGFLLKIKPGLIECPNLIFNSIKNDIQNSKTSKKRGLEHGQTWPFKAQNLTYCLIFGSGCWYFFFRWIVQDEEFYHLFFRNLAQNRNLFLKTFSNMHRFAQKDFTFFTSIHTKSWCRNQHKKTTDSFFDESNFPTL